MSPLVSVDFINLTKHINYKHPTSYNYIHVCIGYSKLETCNVRGRHKTHINFIRTFYCKTEYIHIVNVKFVSLFYLVLKQSMPQYDINCHLGKYQTKIITILLCVHLDIQLEKDIL